MTNKLKLEIRHDNINVALKSINQNQNVDKHRNHDNNCEMELNMHIGIISDKKFGQNFNDLKFYVVNR